MDGFYLRVNGYQNAYGCSIDDMSSIIECTIIGALMIGVLIIYRHLADHAVEEYNEEVLHVLVQITRHPGSRGCVLTPPFAKCVRFETSGEAAVREVREKAGIFLKRSQLELVMAKDWYDCYATNDPVVFGNTKDGFMDECEDATGIQLDWLESNGASWACHGHYWVPVNSLKDLGRNEMDYFIEGTVSIMQFGILSLKTILSFQTERSDKFFKDRSVHSYVLIYKMM
jgi:8-oxo-dGTP pyrophosphatase MutT (NUDIX family)